MSLLVTPSLVGAINWLKVAPRDWERKAYQDLSNQLARVYTEPMSKAIKLGLTFEDSVYAHTASKSGQGSELFQWFVKECEGGQFQRKTKKIVEIEGVEYCLYGKIDVWFPSVLKDIKTTSNYKGPKHYLDSFQHLMYCYTEKVYSFEYIVAVFNEEEKLITTHKVSYTCDDVGALEQEITNRVKEAVEFLKEDEDLWKLYTSKFSRA